VNDDLAILERHLGLSRPILLSLPSAVWISKGLTDEHAHGIAHMIIGNSRLEELSLARNRLTDAGTKLLAEALPASDSLRLLWLSGNRIGDDGARALAEVLPSMGIAPRMDIHGDASRMHVSRGSHLEELWLANNSIGDDGAAAIAAALPAVPRLQKVDLRANRVGEAGACALAAALPSLQLQELYLQENRLADLAAVSLAHALPKCAWLRDLRLTGNLISDSGAAALADAMPKAPQLHGLRLSSNKVRDVGGAALAAALHSAPLQRLELAYNYDLSDASASALAASLPHSELLALDVEGHSTSKEAERALALSILGAAVFGVPYTDGSSASGGRSEEVRPLPLRQLHGLRLVSHVRAMGVLSDNLRDELDNAVLLDLLRAHHGLASDPAPARVVAVAESALDGPPQHQHEASGAPAGPGRGGAGGRAGDGVGAKGRTDRRKSDRALAAASLFGDASSSAKRKPRARKAWGLLRRAPLMRSPFAASSSNESADRAQDERPRPGAGPGTAPDSDALTHGASGSVSLAAPRAPSSLERKVSALTPRSNAASRAAAAHGSQDTFRVHPYFLASPDALQLSTPPHVAAAPPIAQPLPTSAPRPAAISTPPSEDLQATAQALLQAPPQSSLDPPPKASPPPSTPPHPAPQGSKRPTMDRPPTARENDPTELQQAIQSIFDRWDVDGSGQLSLEEFRNGVASEARSPQYKNNPTVRLIAAAVERTGGSKSLE
jgi:hypothetical protein